MPTLKKTGAQDNSIFTPHLLSYYLTFIKIEAEKSEASAPIAKVAGLLRQAEKQTRQRLRQLL
jgi:hypothetical protein